MIQKYDHIEMRGPLRCCPICDEPLMNADAGVHAHLKKHVNQGLLNQKDLTSLKLKILHREFRGAGEMRPNG